jgi:hypothetical protein
VSKNKFTMRVKVQIPATPQSVNFPMEIDHNGFHITVTRIRCYANDGSS